MALTQRHAPLGGFDVSGVGCALEQLRNFPKAYFAVRKVFGKLWLCFQEPLHLCLREKPPTGKAFHCLCDNGRQRLVTHQKLTVDPIRRVAVTYGRVKHPVAFLDARLHLLDYLTAVLFAFQFALRCKNRFNEFSFGRVVQLEVQACDQCAARLKLPPQLDMELGIARKSFQVIKDNDIVFVWLRIEITQQRNHARTIDEVTAPRRIVGEHGFNFIALCRRILAAAMFLAFKPASFGLLARA